MSNLPFEYIFESSARRDRVWVHCSDGSTVGRFSPMGVDLHNSITDQMNGAPECRLCTHGKASVEQWELFIEKAKEFWGVEIPYETFDISILLKKPNPSADPISLP